MEHSKEILEEDCAGILMILTRNNYITKEKAYEESRNLWKNIFKKAQYINIDSNFVKTLHLSYNPKKMTFFIKA